jgi:hypothetical protein
VKEFHLSPHRFPEEDAMHHRNYTHSETRKKRKTPRTSRIRTLRDTKEEEGERNTV